MSNTSAITATKNDFDQGVELFIEILKAQPGLLKADAIGTNSGRNLAEMAAEFSLQYNDLTQKHCRD